MENPIGNLDPRIAMALSGEFASPTDPSERSRTAARLYLGSIVKGAPLEGGQVGFKYSPPWSPADVFVKNVERFLIQVYREGMGPALVVRKPASEYDLIEIGTREECFYYTSPEEISYAASRIAETFGNYFARFEG